LARETLNWIWAKTACQSSSLLIAAWLSADSGNVSLGEAMVENGIKNI